MILAATLVAAILRLWGLGSQSLWVDEVFTWMSAGGSGPFGLDELLENVHGPLYSAAVHLAMQLFGDHEWVLRLPSALAGIAIVPVMAWAAGRWVGARAVVPAAWLAAGSPFLVWYSQEARNYSWLMLAAALSAGAIAGLQRSVDAGRIARLVAVTAFGLLSNLSFVLLAPLHVHAMAYGPLETRGARRRVLAVSALVLALVALPWLPQIARTWDWSRLGPSRPNAEQAAPLRGATTFHLGALPYAMHTLAVGSTLGPSTRELRADASWRALRPHMPVLVATALTFGTLLVLGLAALARRRRLADTLLGLLVPALVISYFALQNFKVFHPRYLAVSMPWLLFTFAAAFAGLRGRSRTLLAAAVGVLWALSLAHLYGDPAYRREDYRGALAAVRGGIGPQEQVVAVGSEEPVVYYGRGLPVTRWWLGHAGQSDRMEQTWDETLGLAQGSWVVLSRSEDLDPSGRFAAWLGARYPQSQPRRFNGITLWHITDSGGASSAPSVAR